MVDNKRNMEVPNFTIKQPADSYKRTNEINVIGSSSLARPSSETNIHYNRIKLEGIRGNLMLGTNYDTFNHRRSSTDSRQSPLRMNNDRSSSAN